MAYQLYCGDCLDILPTLEANSVDAIICDPPYMLNFMGKAFDRAKDNPAASVDVWQAALRVAKPGAHLLAFGGTRTHHRLMCAIEDAGWEIRDCLMWLYGSGFPKSLDIGKAIDKAAGAEREVIGEQDVRSKYDGSSRIPIRKYDDHGNSMLPSKTLTLAPLTAPATDAARQWDGWGTALKPAWEPIIMARKPLTGTVADNVLAWGTGGINVDGCRIGTDESLARPYGGGNQVYGKYGMERGTITGDGLQGRWPANLILDEESAALVDEMSGESKSKAHWRNNNNQGHEGWSGGTIRSGPLYSGHDDTGGASRFFYVAKASKRDRDEGLEGMEERIGKRTQAGGDDTRGRPLPINANVHPTVKPTALMRYLVRLVTPANGVVLDPFMGSGSTGKAAMLEGFSFTGIELDAEYLEIARRRIEAAQVMAETEQMQLPLLELA